MRGPVLAPPAERPRLAGDAEERTAGEIMTRDLLTCTPDQRLRDVLARAKDRDVHQLPVVARCRCRASRAARPAGSPMAARGMSSSLALLTPEK